jgi:hypothetical protein
MPLVLKATPPKAVDATFVYALNYLTFRGSLGRGVKLLNVFIMNDRQTMKALMDERVGPHMGSLDYEKMTSNEVEQAIRALGLAVTKLDGKWRINYRGGKEATAYNTTDDDDALGMAKAMEVARGQQ